MAPSPYSFAGRNQAFSNLPPKLAQERLPVPRPAELLLWVSVAEGGRDKGKGEWQGFMARGKNEGIRLGQRVSVKSMGVNSNRYIATFVTWKRVYLFFKMS
jgi:hypothetical protein